MLHRKSFDNITTEAIAALKADLGLQTWNEVYANVEPNKSYDAFVATLLELYDKHCPVKMVCRKINFEKLWLTNGIKNACKNKNIS